MGLDSGISSFSLSEEEELDPEELEDDEEEPLWSLEATWGLLWLWSASFSEKFSDSSGVAVCSSGTG